jgi:uncharacterized protein (TIGR00266 family)
VRVTVTCQPSYAIAYLALAADEEVYIERGSMASCSDGVSLSAGFGGDGIGKALVRKYLGREPMIFSRVHAAIESAWAAVAPAYPGDIEVIELGPNESLLTKDGSLLAYSRGISTGVAFSGLRTTVMHEGMTMLTLEGPGTVVLSAYGAVENFDLEPGQSLVVDTGHIVAFGTSVTYDVGPLGSITRSVATGEGMVARFTGPGRVITQSRAEQNLREWLIPTTTQNTGR